MGTTTLALLATAVAAASFVQGTIGVGFALILAPILGVLAPELLPGALLLVMLPLNAWVAWRERSALDWHGAGRITVGRVLGGVAGLLVLMALPVGGLQAFVGVATILTALVTLLAPRFEPGRVTFFLAGAVTGVTETATGIGGPPLALAYQHRPAPVLRATVAACFLVGELISVALLLLAGRMSAAQLEAAALLALPLALGLFLSHAARHRVGGRPFRVLVLGFAIVSGAVCLWPAVSHGSTVLHGSTASVHKSTVFSRPSGSRMAFIAAKKASASTSTAWARAAGVRRSSGWPSAGRRSSRADGVGQQYYRSSYRFYAS